MKLWVVITALFASTAMAGSHIRTKDFEEICHAKTIGYKHLTLSEKNAIFQRDGVLGGNHTGKCATVDGCEVDHRVPIELGGSNDPNNLMVQPYDGPCNAHDKDKLEEKLLTMVCSHQLSIQAAQRLIYDDWVSAYKQLIDKNGCAVDQ